MNLLIVKEDMRTEGREDFLFADTAEEEGFVNTHVPIPKRFDSALMGRRTSGGDKGSADRRFFARFELALEI